MTHLGAFVSALATGACAPMIAPAGPWVAPPVLAEDHFIMPDGARLPYRSWRPEAPPRAVILALHGLNDSRNAWEIPAGDFTAGGVAIYAPDQRGFGAAPNRGIFAGVQTLAGDVAVMARVLRARHPGTPLFLMGESMGGAIAMVAAGSADPLPVDGLILLAPAVWGRAHMNALMRGALWLFSHTVPRLGIIGGAPGIRPSDNDAALDQLARDPLTLRQTRVDLLKGIVDLMDAALEAAPRLRLPVLLLYGGHDALVPARPTQAMFNALPPGARVALYSNGHHLLFRDLGRAGPIADTLAWIEDRAAPLPSGADTAGNAWRSR